MHISSKHRKEGAWWDGGVPRLSEHGSVTLHLGLDLTAMSLFATWSIQDSYESLLNASSKHMASSVPLNGTAVSRRGHKLYL